MTAQRHRRAALAVATWLAAALAGAQDLAVPVAGEAPPDRRWSVHVGQSSVFDTNVDQVHAARQDYGYVFMAGAEWRNRLSRPSFEVSYEAALHRYGDSPRWDRVSHRAEAVFEKRLSKRWRTETKGEVSIKGSSEDRELGNWYTLRQRVDFRVFRSLGLRLYGAGRLKRYAEPERDRDATNAYAGAELKLRLGPARLDLGSRRETNEARIERNDFGRWVHEAQLVAALGRRSELGLGVRLYDQQYPHRTVRVGSRREIRQDHRLISSASWNHRLGEALGVELAYTYAGRSSNDPDKEFGAQLFTIGFDYSFDRRRYGATEPSSPRPRQVGRKPIRSARGHEDAISTQTPVEKALALASADEWDQRGISLLNSASYVAAVDLYRQAILQYPSLKARVQNLTGIFSRNGQHELAYCLDPTDSALRRAWEQQGARKEGLCPETR
jgi:hypothetical protein